MFGMSLIRMLPPWASVAVIYYVAPLFLALRFLLWSLKGVLALTILLYWLAWLAADPKPFTPAQLALWVDALPIESKTAVTTAVLTILGFLIAFYTASATWRSEGLAHLKAAVAGDIEVFFNEAARLITDAEIYVRYLVDTVNALQSTGVNPETMFRVKRSQDEMSKFVALRERLSAMSVEVHRLGSRHYSVLSTVWGGTRALEDAAAAFSEMTERMWIRLPIISFELPDPALQFVAKVNVAESSAFLDSYTRNYSFISGVTGGIRGLLLAPLVGVNLASVVSMFGKRAVLLDALSKVRGGPRRGG